MCGVVLAAYARPVALVPSISVAFWRRALRLHPLRHLRRRLEFGTVGVGRVDRQPDDLARAPFLLQPLHVAAGIVLAHERAFGVGPLEHDVLAAVVGELHRLAGGVGERECRARAAPGARRGGAGREQQRSGDPDGTRHERIVTSIASERTSQCMQAGSDRSERCERVEHVLLLQDLGQQQRRPCRAGAARRPGRRLRPSAASACVIAGSRRVQSARTSATSRLARTASRTSSVLSTSRLLTWQVTHQAAVKSTNTGRPAAVSSATRAGVNGVQSRSSRAAPTAGRPSPVLGVGREQRPRDDAAPASAASAGDAPRPRAAAAHDAPRPQREADAEQRDAAGAARASLSRCAPSTQASQITVA